MSREYYQAVQRMHDRVAEDFAARSHGCTVSLRVEDVIYVYLHVDGQHVQTQHVAIWWREVPPSDAAVRRRVHREATIGRARITKIDWR